MVSRKLALEYWHGPSGALGKQIRVSTKDDCREVIGVAADARDDGLHKEAPSSGVLRRRSTLSRQESGHSSFRDTDTEPQQLSMDVGRAS
jgi:hypothetical protein